METSVMRYMRKSNKASVSLDTEGVILDLDSGTYFGLEGIGQRIWELLGEPRTRDELHRTLFDEYEVQEVQLRADLERFLTNLLEHALIEELP